MIFVPPKNIKKIAKRRLDRSTPSNSGKKGADRNETFRNPGNKAGKGLHTRAKPYPDSGDGADTDDYMAKLSAASKKSKTKVQPAARRRVHKMREK